MIVAELRRKQRKVHVVGKADGAAGLVDGRANQGDEPWIPTGRFSVCAHYLIAVHSI